MSASPDWKEQQRAKREANRLRVDRLFPDDTYGRAKNDVLRKILETYDSGELDDVIEGALYRKGDKIDLIMDNGFLDNEIDEIILQEIDEKNPVVAHLIIPIDQEPELVAFQDCDHIDRESGKPLFDLLGYCRICRRPQSKCVE